MLHAFVFGRSTDGFSNRDQPVNPYWQIGEWLGAPTSVRSLAADLRPVDIFTIEGEGFL